MAKARAIIKRRRSVQNIHKITRTMQLIATARFQKAFNRTVAGKPYTAKLMEMVSNIARYASVRHPLIAEPKEVRKVALLTLTSNRGLAGGYNSNILHRSQVFSAEQGEQGRQVLYDVVGKKGHAYLKFLGVKIENYFKLPDEPSYAQVVELADRYMDLFTRGEVDRVYVSYMQFHSTSKQSPDLLQLLPLRMEMAAEAAPTKWHYEFEFTPAAGDLLMALLPEAVKVVLYQCFRDAAVSEHAARMVAMKAATDNAEEMIKLLTRQANKARQAQITRELSELIGG
ncbi:MAG: ATP synthase F1 subunit gamma, partial [Planctomycetes bacterium]|nr:ATP synthase F1 subunit gamma [Planctomycetota bacterium]